MVYTKTIMQRMFGLAADSIQLWDYCMYQGDIHQIQMVQTNLNLMHSNTVETVAADPSIFDAHITRLKAINKRTKKTVYIPVEKGVVHATWVSTQPTTREEWELFNKYKIGDTLLNRYVIERFRYVDQVYSLGQLYVYDKTTKQKKWIGIRVHYPDQFYLLYTDLPNVDTSTIIDQNVYARWV